MPVGYCAVHGLHGLSAGIRVDGSWHIQNVKAYDSRLDGWLRHFHGVGRAGAHLYELWHDGIIRLRYLSPDKNPAGA